MSSVSALPGSAKHKSMLIQDFDTGSRRRLVHLGVVIMQKVCAIINPYDVHGCLKEIVKQEGESILDENKLSRNIIQLQDNLPKITVQIDVIMALLAIPFTSDVLQESFLIGKVKAASLQRKYKHLASGKQPVPPKQSIVQYTHKQDENAVKSILSDTNVSRISWGTKSFMIDATEIHLPKLIRKKSVTLMLQDCMDIIPEDIQIAPASFCKIVKIISTKDTKIK
eukprot:6230802-Ditylum_brightwellii.AAC.1